MDHRGELLCAEESGSEIQMSSDEESENHSLLSSDEQEVWLMKSTNGKQSPMLNLSAFPQKRVLRVYSRRWLVLMLFSLLSFMQCTVWNTWGPISNSSFTAYPSWNASTIALFGNWGTITYVIFTIPFIWICDVYGLRVGTLVSAFLMATGTAIRCISTSEETFTWMAHLGANLNGVAGIVLCSAPPALSSLWFPPNERTTATAISSVLNQLGNAGGFFLGPLMVRDPDEDNGTAVVANQTAVLRRDIERLMDMEALICIGLFLCVLVYFPARPRVPPSVASAVPRLSIKDGVFHLIKNREVLLLTTAFSFSQGILGGWLGVMDINLEIIGFSQAESGWLGVISIVASCLLALAVARLTDILTGRMKLTITVLLSLSAVAFAVLTLMCLGLVETSTPMLYGSVIVGSCANYAASPLFYELAAEVAFPVDETIVGGFMSCIYNLVGAIFLFAFFIPNIGVTWMNYCLVAAPVVSLPFVYLTKEEYRRSYLDAEPAAVEKDRSLLVNGDGQDDEI